MKNISFQFSQISATAMPYCKIPWLCPLVFWWLWDIVGIILTGQNRITWRNWSQNNFIHYKSQMDWPGIICDKVMTKHLNHSTASSNPKTHVNNILKFSSYPTENSLHDKGNVFNAVQEDTSCSFWESWNICGEKCSLLMVKIGTSISYHSQTVSKEHGNY